MAKITFRPQTVKALHDLTERLGISMEEAANNAVLIYRDMIFNERKTETESLLDDFMNSTEFGRDMNRRKRQQEIVQEEEDIAFHKKHKRPYTPIR